MYCKNCGKEVDNGISMCPYCGCDLIEEEEKRRIEATSGSEDSLEEYGKGIDEEKIYDKSSTEDNKDENEHMQYINDSENDNSKNKIESSVNLIKWLMCGGIFCLLMLIAATASMNYYMWKEISKFDSEMSVLPKYEYCTKSYLPEESYTRHSNDLSQTGAYTTIEINQEELIKMGNEGWEIATSYLENETAWPNFGNSDYVLGLQPNIRPQKLVVVFKREIK